MDVTLATVAATFTAVAVGNAMVGADEAVAGAPCAGAVTTPGVLTRLVVLAALGAQADTSNVNRIKVTSNLAWVGIVIAPDILNRLAVLIADEYTATLFRSYEEASEEMQKSGAIPNCQHTENKLPILIQSEPAMS